MCFMKNRYMRPNKISLILALLLTTATGCSEYWWTRGQPPSTQELFSRANERISESIDQRSSNRPEIAANAIEVQKSLSILGSSEVKVSTVLESLKSVENSFKNLERKVSYGNRPPINELSGQLRALENELKKSSALDPGRLSAMRLFGARVLMYLSTELNVPAPDQIT